MSDWHDGEWVVLEGDTDDGKIVLSYLASLENKTNSDWPDFTQIKVIPSLDNDEDNPFIMLDAIIDELTIEPNEGIHFASVTVIADGTFFRDYLIFINDKIDSDNFFDTVQLSTPNCEFKIEYRTDKDWKAYDNILELAKQF